MADASERKTQILQIKTRELRAVGHLLFHLL